MPLYFSDLDDGKTNYVDTIGSELADQAAAEREAIAFLASTFRDASPTMRDRVFVVKVRESSEIIFTTSLTLTSN
jgi:uncharacterized protein DUF6894